MKKINDYILLLCNDTRHLSGIVKSRLQDGYELYGNPIFENDPNDPDEFIAGQAMIKYEEEIK